MNSTKPHHTAATPEEPQENTAPQEPASPHAESGTLDTKMSHPVVKLFAIIGLTAILFAGAWLSVQMIQWFPSMLSAASTFRMSEALPFSWGGSALEGAGTLRLQLPALSVAHGAPFTLTWEYTGAKEGAPLYAFSYTCEEGVSLSVVDGLAIRDLPCGTPYRFSSENQKLLLVARSEKNRFIDVGLSLVLLDDSGTPREETRATQLITVVNERISESPSLLSPQDQGERAEVGAPAAPAQEKEAREEAASQESRASATPQTRVARKPVTVFVPNPRTRENPDGTPDLAIENLAVGASVVVNDKSIFVPREKITGSTTPTISFQVVNQGDRRSDDSWRFRLTIPLGDDQTFTYTSPPQEVLKPGDRIEFTVGLEDLETGEYTATIALLDVSRDKEDANNSAEVTWEALRPNESEDNS